MTTDTCLTADPGVESSILALSHTLMEIDHEIISVYGHFPPSLIHPRKVVVSYKLKYVHEVLVNRLFQACPEQKV